MPVQFRVLLLAGLLTAVQIGILLAQNNRLSPDEFMRQRKIRENYSKEIDTLKAKNPKAYEDKKRSLTLALQMFLARAGYGLGPFDGVLDTKTTAAIREYQKRSGLPVNGDVLDFDLGESLSRDSAALREVIYLPPKTVLFDDWDRGNVFIQGTWTMSNEEMAWPVQTSRISCFRNRGECVESQAELIAGLTALDVNTNFFEIERWDKYEIVTKPSDSLCVRSVIRFNRTQKSVTAVDSVISKEGLCAKLAAKDFTSTIEDGVVIHLKLEKAREQTQERIFRFSPEIVKRSDK